MWKRSNKGVRSKKANTMQCMINHRKCMNMHLKAQLGSWTMLNYTVIPGYEWCSLVSRGWKSQKRSEIPLQNSWVHVKCWGLCPVTREPVMAVRTPSKSARNHGNKLLNTSETSECAQLSTCQNHAVLGRYLVLICCWSLHCLHCLHFVRFRTLALNIQDHLTAGTRWSQVPTSADICQHLATCCNKMQ